MLGILRLYVLWGPQFNISTAMRVREEQSVRCCSVDSSCPQCIASLPLFLLLGIGINNPGQVGHVARLSPRIVCKEQRNRGNTDVESFLNIGVLISKSAMCKR
jgi:hypothetical protein